MMNEKSPGQDMNPDRGNKHRTQLSMNYSILAPEKSEKCSLSAASISILPLSRISSGVYYWNDHIPANLKTRHELLLQYRQPKPGAQVQGVKRSIFEQKWRFGGSTETISDKLLQHYRQEANRGSLSDAEFHYLEVRGYAIESNLYDEAETVPLRPTETNGRNFFYNLCFDGSHKEQYINEANALRENRRTFKSDISRPDILDHLRGFNILGPVKNETGHYRFFSVDLDRHAYIDPKSFAAYVMAVYAFLVKYLPTFAIVVQVNPKNGSVVFFCFCPARRTYGQVHDLVNTLDEKAKKEIPGYKTPEIYPIHGPGKVYLPFNPEKITLGDMGTWPKFRTKKTKKFNPMEVYSLAGFPEYVRTAKKADSDAIERAVTAACQQPMPKRKKNKKKAASYSNKNKTTAGGMGVVPKFKGRFLRTMVDFFTGKVQPDDDTIGKYLTPWARAIAVIEECDDVDELKEKLQRCIDLIPDTNFSDRLSDNPAELERVMGYTLEAIIKNNGYQRRPDESTRIFMKIKKFCDRIGFVPSDPTTWAILDKQESFQPDLELVWTPELAALIRTLTPVLTCTMIQAKDFLKLFFAWVEARNETSYSKVVLLMNQVGISGHNDKVAAMFKIMKAQGLIEKVKNHGQFQGDDGQVRTHGNFYVNTAKIVFREQIGGEAFDQQGIHNLYLLYLSFLSSDSCEYLLEYRRLILEERFRRRYCALYSHTWKKAA
jgi:hypothetical protein